MKEIDQLRLDAYLIINNIAMGYSIKEGEKFLDVADLNNLRYKARFRLSDEMVFELIASTFAEGKRKYEMLYFVERNREELIEGYRDAEIFRG